MSRWPVCAACEFDPGQLAKEIISNPAGTFTGPGGGDGVIVSERAVWNPESDAERILSFDATDDRGPLRIHLLTHGDAALLERERELELRRPALPGGRRSFEQTELIAHRSGPVAFTILDMDARRLEVRLEGGISPSPAEGPARPPGPRLRTAPGNQIETLGPDGAVSASLPATSVELYHGRNGLFLSAGGPMDRYLMPAGNRYLLRVTPPGR